MSEVPLASRIYLSVQRALLGNVSSALRCVAVDWGEKWIRIVCYFDGPVSDEDRESMQLMETEVMADFGDFEVSAEIRVVAQ